MPADFSSHLILAATLAWDQVLQLGPYIVGGIVLAALLGQLDLPRRWGRQLGRSNPGAVIGAACLGSVSEIFDGDYPHKPQGCIAQAWSVAELLRIKKLLRQP